MASTTSVNLRLPEELNNDLNNYAKQNDMTKTSLVTTLLKQGLAERSGSSIPLTNEIPPLDPESAKIDVLSHRLAGYLEQQQIYEKAFSERLDTLEDYTINGIESLTQRQAELKSYLDKQEEQVSSLSVQVESFLSTQTALQAEIDKLSALLTQLQEVYATQGKDCIDPANQAVYSVQKPTQSNLVAAISLSATTDSSSDDEWLLAHQAHAVAQEHGYKYGERAFREIRNQKDAESIYAQYGLEFDRERQGKKGSPSRCWRRLSPNP